MVLNLKNNKSWGYEKFLKAFEVSNFDALSEEAALNVQKKKVMDFYLQQGRVTAKVQDAEGKLQRVELLFKQINEFEWVTIYTALATELIFLTSLLSGEMPKEVEEKLFEFHIDLYPQMSDLEIIFNGEKTTEINSFILSVIFTICEHIDEDPFLLFLLRGKGKDEFLIELKKRRRQLNKNFREASIQINFAKTEEVEHEDLQSTVDRFWKSGERINELSYSLKADELPAALLKRMDSLPLGGLEESTDFILEEAYAYIANRAQAYALSVR